MTKNNKPANPFPTTETTEVSAIEAEMLNTIPDNELVLPPIVAPAAVEESYEVVDLYPQITLHHTVVAAIQDDPELLKIQDTIDYLEAELIAAQNAKHNKEMGLMNEAKAQVHAKQVAKDTQTLLNASKNENTRPVLAQSLNSDPEVGPALVLLAQALQNPETKEKMLNLASGSYVEPQTTTPTVYSTRQSMIEIATTKGVIEANEEQIKVSTTPAPSFSRY